MGRLKSLRREVLVAFGVLFAGGVLLATGGMALLLPLMERPLEAILYILTLILADLVIILFVVRIILGRALLRPMDRLVEDVQTIAAGAYGHRVQPLAARELQALADSVNAMAERLIRDQERLAENVRSLDETNLALVAARTQVIRAARLASTGTLASGIAHELGNPLGALMAYADVARSRALTLGQDAELVDSIREEAARMDRIIRSLVDFARSKGGERIPSDPRPVILRVRELLEAQGRLEGVEVLWEEWGTADPKVLMDPQRLEQVLLNLLLNALDALEGREDPWIRVRLSSEAGPSTALPRRRQGDPPGVDYAHRRRVVPGEDGGRITPLATAEQVVILTVEDNGPGIPAERLEELFDPFFTTKEPGKGTGLGLALSAQLVEGMGGEIRGGNRREGGAIFTVRLPEVAGYPGMPDLESQETESPLPREDVP